MNTEGSTKKLSLDVTGFPGTIFLEVGDPSSVDVPKDDIKHVELRLSEDKILINYQFKTFPVVEKVHVSRVIMHSPNSWDVYFYNYSAGQVNVEVKPLFGYYQQ